jgi:hypothetical protein
MPLLNSETWRAYEAEGKSSLLLRRFKFGLIGGVGAGVGMIVEAIWLDPQRPSASTIITLLVVSIVVSVVGYVAPIWILWALLRRKFSDQ